MGAAASASPQKSKLEARNKAIPVPPCCHATGLTPKRFRKTLRHKFPQLAPARGSDSSDESSDDETLAARKQKASTGTPTLRCVECESEKELWLCLHCGKVLCLDAAKSADHAIAHTKKSKGCHLMLSCLDSHIFCCTCSCYLYPRELSGLDDTAEALLTPLAETWLQILGTLLCDGTSVG